MRRFALLVAGLGLLAVVLAGVSGGATQAERRWVITDLGTLGGAESRAVDINDRGQIIGWADTKVKDRDGNFISDSVIWENGKMRAIRIDASDINARGQVAGSVRLKKHERAALWENGKTRILGTLSREQNWWTEGIALNDRSQVIGNDIALPKDDTTWRGFLWEQGAITDLGSFGGSTTNAEAINNRGQVIGTSDTEYDPPDKYSQTHGFLWENGKMTDLGARFRLASPAIINDRGQIPGSAHGRAAVWYHGAIRYLASSSLARGVVAHDINQHGTIAGACIVPPRPQNRLHPCLWRDGKVLDLGLVYGDGGKALAVSDREQVIGNSRAGRGKFHAFVWENGRMTDLGTLPGGKESQALAINNQGQIIGWSETKTGSQHAVLWTLKRG